MEQSANKSSVFAGIVLYCIVLYVSWLCELLTEKTVCGETTAACERSKC